MHRRGFFYRTAASALAAAGALSGPMPAAAATSREALMKGGTQHSDADGGLKIISSFGVKNICSERVAPTFDERWSVEALVKMRERVNALGVSLDMISLPLSPGGISKSEAPGIMGAGPTRDRDIDTICQMIRNSAKAGIP